jgi:SWIM/SEC-C metal-binding protein
MRKLGTCKNPAIVRVQNQIRAQEIMSTCSENDWQVIIGIEPDKIEDISDVTKLLNPQLSVVNTGIRIGRNDPCTCGSRKKYKKCCLNVSLTA